MTSNGDSGNSRRINIKVPDLYSKVNEEVWNELEEYVFTGFLSSSASMFKHDFVFKTLNHHEVNNIIHIKQSRHTDRHFRSAFIAYSLYVAMGKNVLYGRQDHIGKLIEFVSKIPDAFQTKIVDNLNYLNKRANKLHPLVEVYAHENRSRYRWLYLKKLPVHSSEATGIPGTAGLGMNYCQQTWVAMNEVMDKKEETEISWNHSKFIGSCFAGKGMISVDEQDKARKNREQQELEEKKMQVLREYVAAIEGKEIESTEGTVSLPDGRRAVVEGRFKAETVEELADQLSAALSGEKDWHDKIVEDHFRRAKAEKEAIVKQSRQIALSTGPIDMGAKVAGGARILSQDSADAYVKRMQALMIRPHAAPTPPPDVGRDPDKQ